MSIPKHETYNEFEEMDKELEEYEESTFDNDIVPPISSAEVVEAAILDEDAINWFRMIGNKIRGERKFRKISQNRLCKLAGISRPTLSTIESGERGSIVNLYKVLYALEVDIKFGWWCE